jgi:hypothetical protein
MQSIPNPLDHEIVLINYTGGVLWWYQMSHHKRVTIKVELGTPKVVVEDHGSRVEFVHPDDRPSRWYCIETACKHMTRSKGCHITERVKSTCQVTRSNKVQLIPMIESRTSKISQDRGIRIRRLWFNRSQDSSLCGSHYGSLDLADDYWSEKCFLIMSTLFVNRRVTHLKIVDAFDWIRSSAKNQDNTGTYWYMPKWFRNITLFQGVMC